MKLYIGADHRGFDLKERLKPWLSSLGYDCIDCGNTKNDPLDDFPDFAFRVCEEVIKSPESRGILVCGSGGGMAMAANKCRGIRAVYGNSLDEVEHSRNHHDINVVAISSDFTGYEEAQKLIELFLTTPFAGDEKFKRRISKMMDRATLL